MFIFNFSLTGRNKYIELTKVIKAFTYIRSVFDVKLIFIFGVLAYNSFSFLACDNQVRQDNSTPCFEDVMGCHELYQQTYKDMLLPTIPC